MVTTQPASPSGGGPGATPRKIDWLNVGKVLGLLVLAIVLFLLNPFFLGAFLLIVAIYLIVKHMRQGGGGNRTGPITLNMTKGWSFGKVVGVLLLIVMVTLAVFVAINMATGGSTGVGSGWLGKVIGNISIFIAKVIKFFSLFDPMSVWDNFFNKQVAIAEGRYYEGEVEENQYTQLGVYLEDIETSDPEYFEGDEITVWGTLNVKSLGTGEDDMVEITVSCWMDDENNKGKVEGPEKLKVFSQEDVAISCSFEDVKAGAHSVYIKAEYGFTTLSYVKSYYMDFDKKRAMLREKIDIFDEFGITDKNPVAVFTNGPVKIGMATSDNQPIPVKTDDSYLSRLGITIENRDQGYISSIKKISLQLPLGMMIKSDGCDHTVTEVTSEQCKSDCDSSTIIDPMQCKNDCDHYKFYDVSIKSKKIKTFQNSYCRVNYDPSYLQQLLGSSPVSTKYIRATIRYDYTLEKSTMVYVQPKPVEEK